jgi:hypothetical protein
LTPADSARVRRSETAAFHRPEQPSPADVPVSSALPTNNARYMVGVSSHSQVQDASRRCLFGKPR